MTNIKRTIYYSIFESLLLAVLMIIVPVLVALDVVVIGHGLPELSFTEISQELLILMSALIFAYDARYRIQERGFLVLVAGFFGCMFIRECDALLDNIVHGFWVYPAFLLAFGSIYYASLHQETVLYPMIKLIRKKHFAYLLTGLVFVLLFSRLFGTGGLWREIMGGDYNSLYKNIIQEGLELTGYTLIGYGSIMHLMSRKVYSGDSFQPQDESDEKEKIHPDTQAVPVFKIAPYKY